MISEDKVFILKAYPYLSRTWSITIVTPPTTTRDAVTAAWAYAIRYSAKGLDLPDFEAAARLLFERHPSWLVLTSPIESVNPELRHADSDVPEKP